MGEGKVGYEPTRIYFDGAQYDLKRNYTNGLPFTEERTHEQG
jgi:hypothetical protein